MVHRLNSWVAEWRQRRHRKRHPEPHDDPTVPRKVHAVDISATMSEGRPVYKQHGPLNR